VCPALSETQACNSLPCTTAFVPKYGFSSGSDSNGLSNLGAAPIAGVVAGVCVIALVVAFIVVRHRRSASRALEADTVSRHSSVVSEADSQNPLYAGVARDFNDEESTLGMGFQRDAEQ
jgi:hypothetical protein